MKQLTKEEIEKIALEITEEWKNDYNDNSNSNFIKNIINLIDQNTKPLIDEIAELRNAVNEYHDLYRDSCHENAKLKEQLKQQVECTEHIKEICDEYEMQNNKLQSI